MSAYGRMLQAPTARWTIRCFLFGHSWYVWQGGIWRPGTRRCRRCGLTMREPSLLELQDELNGLRARRRAAEERLRDRVAGGR